MIEVKCVLHNNLYKISVPELYYEYYYVHYLI